MFFEASVLWNFRMRWTCWNPGQNKIRVPTRYQGQIMERLCLLQVRASQVWLHQKWGCKAQNLLNNWASFSSSSRGDQMTRNCTVRAGLTRVIDRAISHVKSQQEGPAWEKPCWSSALRRPMASSLLGEQRTWVRAADVLLENYFSALVAWWIAFLHWKEF